MYQLNHTSSCCSATLFSLHVLTPSADPSSLMTELILASSCGLSTRATLMVSLFCGAGMLSWSCVILLLEEYILFMFLSSSATDAANARDWVSWNSFSSSKSSSSKPGLLNGEVYLLLMLSKFMVEPTPVSAFSFS